MRRIGALALLALVPMMLFSACGGGESEGDKVEDAVIQIATAKSTEQQEAVCRGLLTRALIEEVYGGSQKRCLDKPFAEEDEFTEPGETQVASVEIEDPKATVMIETVGGDTDGVNGTWTMAKEAGEWKLDRIEDDYLRAEFTRASEIVDDGLISFEPMRQCFLSSIDDLDSKDLRAITFGEASGEKKASFDAANKIAEGCPHALDLYVAKSLREEVIDKKKVSKKVSDCAQKQLVGLLAISGLSPQALKQNNEFGDSTAAALSALIASAVRDCRGLPPL